MSIESVVLAIIILFVIAGGCAVSYILGFCVVAIIFDGLKKHEETRYAKKNKYHNINNPT